MVQTKRKMLFKETRKMHILLMNLVKFLKSLGPNLHTQPTQLPQFAMLRKTSLLYRGNPNVSMQTVCRLNDGAQRGLLSITSHPLYIL